MGPSQDRRGVRGQRGELGLGLEAVGALGEHVGLGLGLGAAGPEQDPGAVGEPELEDVRLGKALGLTGRVDDGHRRALGVIDALRDGGAADMLRSVTSEAGHHRGHVGRALGSLVCLTEKSTRPEAICLIEALHGLVEVQPQLLPMCCELADEHGGDHGVLVAHGGAGEVAVGLLEAHEEVALAPLGLQYADLLADELEAGERAAQLQAAGACDVVCHGRGDDSGAGDFADHVGAGLARLGSQEVEQQQADLVTGEQFVLTCMRDGDADAVGVRVGGQEQVGLDPFAVLEPELKCLANLGVWVWAGREVAVLDALLVDGRDIGHADPLEHSGHALQTDAVERGVDDVKRRAVLARGDLERLLYVTVKNTLGNPLHQPLIQGSIERHLLYAIEAVDGVDGRLDGLRRLDGDLAAVGSVDLVAVVCRGIVRRGDVDAGRTAQGADGEAECGRGLNALEQIRLDSVFGENLSDSTHKLLGTVTGIAAEGDGRVLKGAIQVIRQALRSLTDGIDVQTVGPETDFAAQSTGAKG